MTDYNLKRAIIESTRKISVEEPGSNFICRIIPDMYELGPIDLLPRYPSFLAGDQPSYTEGDVVWVVCTEDFQIGYILGLAESPIGTKNTSLVVKINEAETEAGLEESAVYDLTFTSRQDGILDFYNKNNHQSGRIYSTGVSILYGADGSFYMKHPKSIMKVSALGEVTITGEMITETSSSHSIATDKEYTEDVGSKRVLVLGSSEEIVSGSASTNIAGSLTENVAGGKSELIGGAETKTVGGLATEIDAIGKTVTVPAGGYAITVAAGGIAITATAGIIAISAPVGAIALTSPLTSLGSPGPVSLTKLNGQVSLPSVGFPVPNPASPGFNLMPICPITGLPHGGNLYAGLGV